MSAAEDLTDAPPRRGSHRLLLVVLAVAVAAGAGWGAARIAAPTEVAPASAPYATVEVVEGTVGQSLALVASATWPSGGGVRNQAAGTVTSVDVAAGQQVSAGARLYTVDLRPVVAAQGAVPSFRDLSTGAKGEDVTQLQRFLASVGQYRGRATGTFDSATSAAVSRWQRSLGIETDGTVRRGDLLYLPSLPGPVRLRPEAIGVGLPLAGGEEAVETVAPVPQILLNVTDAQNTMIADDVVVRLTAPDGTTTWDTRVAARVADETGTGKVLTLLGEEGASPCGESCSLVPVVDRTSLPAVAVIVPDTTGLVVPSAALATRADGTTSVTTADGTTVTVEVLADASGRAVVTGVEAGAVVRVPPARG